MAKDRSPRSLRRFRNRLKPILREISGRSVRPFERDSGIRVKNRRIGFRDLHRIPSGSSFFRLREPGAPRTLVSFCGNRRKTDDRNKISYEPAGSVCGSHAKAGRATKLCPESIYGQDRAGCLTSFLRSRHAGWEEIGPKIPVGIKLVATSTTKYSSSRD